MTEHGWLVQELGGIPGVRTRGFRAAMRGLILDEEIRWIFNNRFRFLPDAFAIDREKREVVCFEVEVSHAVKLERLHLYGDLWFCFDDDCTDDDSACCAPIGLRLIVVDKRGGNTEYDLCGLAYSSIAHEVGRPELLETLRAIRWTSAGAALAESECPQVVELAPIMREKGVVDR